jgi:hypothetical protein
MDPGGLTRPDLDVATPELGEVERAIREAIDRRRPCSLPTVGSGEFTLAVHWRHDGGECVVKRVPPFSSRARAEEYTAIVFDYIARLEASGVRCVRTAQHIVDRHDGSAVVYEIQPRLDASALADEILRAADVRRGHPVVGAIVDRIVAAVGQGVPIDGQAANWYWFEGEPWQLDLSTPPLVDETGEIPYEAMAFLRQFPKIVRGYVYKEFRRLAPKFGDVAYVITDVMTQLNRQELPQWCGAVADYAREAHGIEVFLAEATRLAAEEATFYPMLHRMKRAQRWWVQHTGRRYDTLLPPASSYG